MKTNFKQWLLAAACTLAACLPLASFAGPYFPSKDGSMILDKATNLVWQRCSVSQVWNGTTCTGTAEKFHFEKVDKLTTEGWRVPTVRELASLIWCSSGQMKSSDNPRDGGAAIANSCDGNFSRPTINTVAFPVTSGNYWSSSSDKGDPRGAWYVGFNYGGVDNINYYYNNAHYAVRLVRASQLVGSEATLEFPLDIDEAKRIAEAKRAKEERISNIKRQEEERKAKAQRAAAENSLLASGAQALYLQAGKAQRSGSVSIGGVSFSASELYEMIVEKFPTSEYAVKATDQLTAMTRSNREQSATRSAAEMTDFNSKQRAYEACRVEMNSCYARTNGKGNCYRDCERLR
jgi:hypothetical protein